MSMSDFCKTKTKTKTKNKKSETMVEFCRPVRVMHMFACTSSVAEQRPWGVSVIGTTGSVSTAVRRHVGPPSGLVATNCHRNPTDTRRGSAGHQTGGAGVLSAGTVGDGWGITDSIHINNGSSWTMIGLSTTTTTTTKIIPNIPTAVAARCIHV